MKTFSLFLNIFNLVVVAASLAALIPATLVFRLQESPWNVGAWILTGALGMFPVVAIASAGMGWLKWSQGAFELALKWGAIAPIYAIIIGICLVVVSR